jgi:D-glycero-D-manno-heptose 1,7-bisphosphate phosphatase
MGRMMNAVFVHQNVLMRDSHIDPDSLETSHLVPATVEAMRMLASEDTLVFLYGTREDIGEDSSHDDELDLKAGRLVRQIEAGGGRVDALIACPHKETQECCCWGDYPGLLWLPALQFNLSLHACYVLGDSEQDVATAHTAGARPMMVLGGRLIGQVCGDLPLHKDTPIAPDLTTAVRYIVLEEEIRAQLGRSHQSDVPMPSQDVLYADPGLLPELTIISRLARSLQTDINRSRVQLRDVGRWLSFFSIGAVGLSLGIAYLLTHLYRVQPFPEFVYYLTLQFVPRPVRGAIFVLGGAAIIYLALRSFYRSTARWRRPPSS